MHALQFAVPKVYSMDGTSDEKCHDSGYLGMAVQLYVQAHLGHYHILTQEEYSQELMAQLKSTPFFTYTCKI